MRTQAAHIRDPLISGGFISLAEQYEQLAAGDARWLAGRDGANLKSTPRNSTKYPS